MGSSCRRQIAYRDCSRFVTGQRCVSCKHPTWTYVKKKHLRGCPHCGRSLRMRFVNRYLPRLKWIHRAKLRHVIFSYRWIDADFEKSADWLLGQVRVLYLRLKWEGMVASVE